MISWTVGSATTTADVDEAFKCRRRLVFVILISINICSQGSCSGVFQFHFTSFENHRDRCCDGGDGGGGGGGSDAASSAAAAASASCRSPCRTLFSLCLRHFQHQLPSSTTDLQCTYGENTTGIIARNSFHDSDDDDDAYLVEMPFDFTWPGAFSLVIKAWHVSTNVGPSDAIAAGSGRTLVGEYSIKQSLSVSDDWRQGVYVSQSSRLAYRYRVVCNVNYVGPGCSEKCTPRNDKLGHYTCSQKNTSKACLPGWTGEYCQTAICLEGCNTTNGFCDQPFECKCRLGWQGRLCDECMPYPGCLHGGCSNRWQCNCYDGWGGLFCNQDLNFCTNNAPCVNGATCKNTGEGSYSCFCPIGFTGTNCEIEVFDCHRNACINTGVCEKLDNGQHRCRCPEGFSGRRCESNARSCRDSPCRHGGVCHSVGGDAAQTTTGYRCQCSPGFTGSNCEVDIDECASSPCQNGGRCVDEAGRYGCACAAGFTGDRCERDRNDCMDSPCLNGGSCVDDVDRFRCRCVPGFAGDLCQDDVDDCLTLPCANGATCVDGDNAVLCRCAGGFTGRDCSAKIDECRSSPCGVGGVCRDLMNGYRCQCRPGFTGSNCERQRQSGVAPSPPPSPPPPASDETLLVQETINGNNASETSVSPGTDLSRDDQYDRLRHTVVVACIGLLLTLLVLVFAVVAFVLYRRHRLRSAARNQQQHHHHLHHPSQKMNNSQQAEDAGGDGADKSKAVTAGRIEPSRPPNRPTYLDFATFERAHLQRNINHTNNLKNVEKCPNRKRGVLFWAAGVDAGAAAVAVAPSDGPAASSRTHRGKTDNADTWKQHSDGTLSEQVSTNPAFGTLQCSSQYPTIFNEATIATEV